VTGDILTAIAQSSDGDNLVPLYYISAIVVSVGTAIWALARWFDKQKQKWQHEATHDAHLGDELRANTDAAEHNTEAIKNLANEMGAFASKAETELNGHSNRLGRLEEYAMYGTAPYHFRGGPGMDDPRNSRGRRPLDDVPGNNTGS
jgi:hypothetical protein